MPSRPRIKIMASAVLFDRDPFERIVRFVISTTGGTQVFPVLRGEVVEGEQGTAILLKHSTALSYFDASGLD
jgi:hypothetical protein